MKNIKYIVADPTKNITVLVTSSVPSDERVTVSQELFDLVPGCEQVGFVSNPLNADEGNIETADYRIDMMGGEFCGNAAISAASYYAYINGQPAGTICKVIMSSSGVCNDIPVKVKRDSEYDFTCDIRMPKAEKITDIEGYPVVYLPGISHMIIPAEEMHIEEAQKLIRSYQKKAGTPAFGMLMWDEEKQYMCPLVYVADTDTVVPENGCATGSTAIGYYRATSGIATSTDVKQPGGTIKIRVSDNQATLTGHVSLIKI